MWAVQREHAVELVAALGHADVTAFVVKGADLVPRCFAGRPLSTMSDVDVVVRPSDTRRAAEVLLALGYRQGRVDRREGTLAPSEGSFRPGGDHYELAPFVKLVAHRAASPPQERWPLVGAPARPRVAVEVDLHYGLATNIRADAFLSRLVPCALGAGAAMSPSDHVWFLASRLYSEVAFHGKRTLRELAQVTVLVRDHLVDWDVVGRAAAGYRLGPSLFHVLDLVDLLLGGAVPAAVLARCDPARGDYRRDGGPCLLPLLGATSREEIARGLRRLRDAGPRGPSPIEDGTDPAPHLVLAEGVGDQVQPGAPARPGQQHAHHVRGLTDRREV